MTDGHFSNDEWAAIVVHIPSKDPDQIEAVRRRLEAATNAHLFQGAIRSDMTDAKGKRDRWRRVQSIADDLRKAVGAIDEWSPPVWGTVVQPEQAARERDHWIKELEILSRMATENSWDYDSYTKRTSDRARFSEEILHVWADDLHQQLRFSRRDNLVRGPLWNFFNAVASPILGDRTPKPETFAKIVKNVKDQRLCRGDGKKKSKRPSRAPCPMVP